MYKYLAILFAFFSISTKSQIDVEHFFCLNQVDTLKVKEIENSYLSKRLYVSYQISFSDDYVVNAKEISYEVEQPMIYERNDTNSVFVIQINYFYSKFDKRLRLVDYTYENFKDFEMLVAKHLDTININNHLNIEYDKLMDMFNKYFGISHFGNGEKIIKSQPDYKQKWIERMMIWKKEKTNIELFLINTVGNECFGTNRLRVIIYWDK